MAPLLFVLLATLAHAGEFTGRVIRVSGGDTITVLAGGAVRVRLAGIDCPEEHQPYGQTAMQFTSELAYRTVVTVKAVGRDRNGRTLGEVTLMDGRSLNQELVRNGLAWWSRASSRDESLGALEAEARAAKRGLWADPDPLPPWEFRRQRRRH